MAPCNIYMYVGTQIPTFLHILAGGLLFGHHIAILCGSLCGVHGACDPHPSRELRPGAELTSACNRHHFSWLRVRRTCRNMRY